MLKFAANITTMFNESDPVARLKHANELGFRWVEWLFPYELDICRILDSLVQFDLELVLINTALGDPRAGERGIGALPTHQTEFALAIEETLHFIKEIHVPFVHVMAGICPNQKDRPLYLETFARNLEYASAQIPDGTTLLIEPLNRIDTPNYLISTIDEATELLDIVDCDIGIQFDFYHLQLMSGNLGNLIRSNFDHIEHIQFSSVPGRNEPQYGEVNCDFLFGLLEQLDYKGFIGCEYSPKTTVEEGLVWAKPYGF